MCNPAAAATGMVHFHKEKYVPRGGPDGGDGGRGGNVILEVNPKINTLFDFSHRAHYIADDGKPGGPNNMSGKSAQDLVVSVPLERWSMMLNPAIC